MTDRDEKLAKWFESMADREQAKLANYPAKAIDCFACQNYGAGSGALPCSSCMRLVAASLRGDAGAKPSMERFEPCMNGFWEVVKHEPHHDGRTKLTYRSKVNPLIEWSFVPYAEHKEELPPIGAIGRMGFVFDRSAIALAAPFIKESGE